VLREPEWAGRTRLTVAAPGPFDLAQQGRVDDPVPERGDERHVLPAEPAARLDVDGHLALVAAVAAIDPGQVHHGVHGLVGDLRGEFGVGAVDGREPGAERQAGRRAAEVGREPFGQ